MFYEMFLEISEKYVGGDLVDANNNDKLFKGIMSFMNVELQNNEPYVIKATPNIEVRSS